MNDNDEIRGTSIPVVIPFGEPDKLESKMNETNLIRLFILKITW